MGILRLFIASSAALSVLAGSGCGSKSDSGKATQPQQNFTPGSGGQNPSNPQQPGNPSGGYTAPISTNLVKVVQFSASANTLLTPTEKTTLENEFLECGVSDALIPACEASNFIVSAATINSYGGGAASIKGRVGRYKDSGKTLYLFRFEQTGAANSSLIQIYAPVSAFTTDLNDLADQAETELNDLPASERLAKLEDTLAVKQIANPQEWSFANESEFATAYAAQSKPRTFYHWTFIALSKGYKSAAVIQSFSAGFSVKLGAAGSEYKELFLELGLNSADFWKVSTHVVEAFRTEYQASSDASFRGKLAISILGLAPAQDAASEHLVAAKDFLLGTSESQWIRRGVALFTKYGSVFGSSTDLVRFGSSNDSSIRREVAKALINYSDGLANQWVLRLNADSYGSVRDEALRTIQGRNYDFSGFDVASLINVNDSSSRLGLAKGLQHARGVEVNIALLRLNADGYGSVRDAALAAIAGRDLDVGSFNTSSLINTNDSSSRFGLARALQYSKNAASDEALLRLNADGYGSVRDAAYVSINDRNCDMGVFEVSILINVNDSSSRFGLARALKYVVGKTASEALLRLNADGYGSVRDAALLSITNRNYDYVDFNVPGLINTNDSSSRMGLAKALKFGRGTKVNETLLQLSADGYGSVRDAALGSIQANPFDAGSINVSSYINPNDSSSRLGLAKALKYVTGQQSINTLITLVSDSYGSVRNAAKESLRAHGIGN